MHAGEMAEWLKAHAWKACLGETLTWVRIPLSPPLSYSMSTWHTTKTAALRESVLGHVQTLARPRLIKHSRAQRPATTQHSRSREKTIGQLGEGVARKFSQSSSLDH